MPLLQRLPPPREARSVRKASGRFNATLINFDQGDIGFWETSADSLRVTSWVTDVDRSKQGREITGELTHAAYGISPCF